MANSTTIPGVAASQSLQHAGYNLHYSPTMAFGPPMMRGKAFGLLQLGSIKAMPVWQRAQLECIRDAI